MLLKLSVHHCVSTRLTWKSMLRLLWATIVFILFLYSLERYILLPDNSSHPFYNRISSSIATSSSPNTNRPNPFAIEKNVFIVWLYDSIPYNFSQYMLEHNNQFDYCNLPPIVATSFYSWHHFSLKDNWNVYLINLTTAIQLLPEIKEYILFLDEHKKPAALSDVLMLALLSKFGGIYIDGDVVCVRSISSWINDMFVTTTVGTDNDNQAIAMEKNRFENEYFFTYSIIAPPSKESVVVNIDSKKNDKHHKDSGPRTVSWFIAANKDSYIIHEWYNQTLIFWTKKMIETEKNGEYKNAEYFWVQRLFTNIFYNDVKFRNIILNNFKVILVKKMKYIKNESDIGYNVPNGVKPNENGEIEENIGPLLISWLGHKEYFSQIGEKEKNLILFDENQKKTPIYKLHARYIHTWRRFYNMKDTGLEFIHQMIGYDSRTLYRCK